MKIVVNLRPFDLLAKREVKGEPRYYYRNSAFPQVLIVSQQKPIEQLQGQLAIVLFGEANPYLVADLTKGKEEMSIQATVKQVKKLPYGKPILLTEAIDIWLSRLEEGVNDRR